MIHPATSLAPRWSAHPLAGLRQRTCADGERPTVLLRFAPLVPHGAARSITWEPVALPSLPTASSPRLGRTVPADLGEARAARDMELATLLQAAATGDAAAFERFYDQTHAYAQALARRMLGASDVDDVVADAFFQTWRDARQFDESRGSPVTWLLTIVRSRALDLLRHHRASPECAVDEATADQAEAPASLAPPDLLSSVESTSRLHAALSTLSAQERWVLALAYYRELTHREVCTQTGLPLGTVKSLILRAQAKLRTQLQEVE